MFGLWETRAVAQAAGKEMNHAVEVLLKSLAKDFRDMPISNARGNLTRWKRIAESKLHAALIAAENKESTEREL